MDWSTLESTTSIQIEKRGGELDNMKYVKFMVLYNKKGNPPNAVPWTGIDRTIEFIREKLEDGYIVQVKPFTMEEWARD